MRNLRLRREGLMQSVSMIEQRILPAAFAKFIDPNPQPNNGFGTHVVPLKNGNVVITAPTDDAGGTDAGAVYLFNGASGALISTLRGSHDYDRAGAYGVVELSGGNVVVNSPFWGNGVQTQVGAVTWMSGITGLTGVISASNSLVGDQTGDGVGGWGVKVLSNGNYVVMSSNWRLGTGAVTWGAGSTGVRGVVSAANSLVGSTSFDQIGGGFFDSQVNDGFRELPTGNFLILSPGWMNGSADDAGAVTWGSGTTGVRGVVSAANSLVGSSTNDRIGGTLRDLANFGNAWKGEVVVLNNGNYVVNSPGWDAGVGREDSGAVTWGSGISGVVGIVGAGLSLVGERLNDVVGFSGVTELANGNYVVSSPHWSQGSNLGVGAVTWGNGLTGVRGRVSSANSLTGSRFDDRVGFFGIVPLTQGNYVVLSPYWDNGTVREAGAVTWVNGSTAISGVVNSGNSLVGTRQDDGFGRYGVTALTNGNYVVSTPNWSFSSTVRGVGAVTWGSGTSGVQGTINETKSLIGSQTGDRVGGFGVQGIDGGITALPNGNYVIASPFWKNGAVDNAGAVTLGNGATGTVGRVSIENSLVGTKENDRVGAYIEKVDGGQYFVVPSITVLANGNYVVASPLWNDGAGAVTWVNAVSGLVGAVSSSNSLTGSAPGQFVGSGGSFGRGVTPLSNGNYVVSSPQWDYGKIANVGAVTWGRGTGGTVGIVSRSNSLTGSSQDDRIGSDFYKSSVNVWIRGGIQELMNGNYVIVSPLWNNGKSIDAGAVTWGSGTSAIQGAISSKNSLVGTLPNESVGYHDFLHPGLVVALPDGNYVIHRPPRWEAEVRYYVVTWQNGSKPTAGIFNEATSIPGSQIALDEVNKNFYVSSDSQVVVGSLVEGTNAPFLSNADVSLAENSRRRTLVTQLKASERDPKQTVTYEILEGNSSGAFAINAKSGAITVARPELLDFETTPIFRLRIRVTDSGSPRLSDVATVTIRLTDVPEGTANSPRRHRKPVSV